MLRPKYFGQLVVALSSFLSADATVTKSLGTGLDRLHKPCPRSCTTFPDQADWDSYYSVDRLSLCNEPLLLTFATFFPLDDAATQVKIRTCTTGDSETAINALTGTAVTESSDGSDNSTNANLEAHQSRIARSVDEGDVNGQPPICYDASSTNATAEWITWGLEHNETDSQDVLTSLHSTQTFLQEAVNCEESVVYGYTHGTVIGVYAGPKIQNRGVAAGFVQTIIDRLAKTLSAQSRVVAQVCGEGRNSDHHLGVVVDPTGDLAWTQQALRSWSEAKCVNASQSDGNVTKAQFTVTVPVINSAATTKLRTRHTSNARECHRVMSAHGDSVESLASTCRITTDELRRYNQVGEDWAPSAYDWRATEPRPDGTCASYIAQANDITEDDIYTFNKDTWGWGGCNAVFPGYRICVGPGTPRLPAPQANAICGPSKPGTVAIDGVKIEDLSPCPIKACCNFWGNCGVDRDFYGCVQNCGMDLVTGSAPSDFMKVGYFESWNRERPCLHMSPKDIPSSYTHVHYAFADITSSFGVSLGRFSDVFDEFKALTGFKRVVAFGGWAFSTEPETYQLFRDAVKAGNRETFATAIVDFVTSNGLDGVDFDWEYPGEPDIPGIPAGTAEDAENYLEFVKTLKGKMPAGKTMSIAAPASYWYLKQFLIGEMSEYLDYIVYMTYDLHGQWDYGNEWSQSGCSAGNCLRSHVNMTETMSALVMITKAGVPSNQVVVGVTSYGRSFKMTDASCSGPQCTYTGPDSGAKHGKCTDTGGYISDGEIEQIIADGGAVRQWSDDTQSNYIIYDDDSWVAYMDRPNKQARIAKFQGLNFRGTTDWAIDLGTDIGSSNDTNVVYLAPEVYSDTPAQCQPPCLFVFAPSSMSSPTTITIPAYTTSIQLDSGSITTITVHPSALTVTSMSFSNMNISSSQNTGTIKPYLSVNVPPLPPWPLITLGPPDTWDNSTTNLGGSGITGDPTGDSTITLPTPSGDTTVGDLPTITKPPFTWDVPTATTTDVGTWPTGIFLTPVPTPVDEDNGEDDDGDGPHHKSTCKLWFFFVCVDWDSEFGIKINGWDWDFPVGVWGP
ncbi:hypothetical protein GGR57DRAFT_496245 [Xylariaceae sp. FL1272]|nr:hypothetical protein GGR57DRAFT_496245 [Xylariaceae sp. FL1272]